MLDATRGFIYLEEFERRSKSLAKTKKEIQVWGKAAGNLRKPIMAALDGSDASRYALTLLVNEYRRANQDDRFAAIIGGVGYLEVFCQLALTRLKGREHHEVQWVKWIQHWPVS